MSREDYQDALRTERHDGTDDPDLHDAGEHPPFERITIRPNVAGADLFTAALGGEMARLEHPHVVAAVMALRAETEFGTESWFDAYRALMDVAARIEGAA